MGRNPFDRNNPKKSDKETDETAQEAAVVTTPAGTEDSNETTNDNPLLDAAACRDSWFSGIVSSMPFLVMGRVVTNVAEFVLPAWMRTSDRWRSAPFSELWDHAMTQSSSSSIRELVSRHFPTNPEGHVVLPAEYMAEIVSRVRAMNNTPQSLWAWLSREWPLMDWKLGVFLWQSFGGMLLVLTVLSIVPGRIHGVSARILRWPVLGMTYFLITVELFVYVCIRVVIYLAEYLVANPKHRKLRRQMSNATSYEHWYVSALELDKSQKRNRWQNSCVDDTRTRYNWCFIQELMNDMRLARSRNDSLLALAVLQQCTRKNVGGIMSEDLFSYTNTGEPKQIVVEFVEEVTTTLKWVTDEAMKIQVSKSEPQEQQDKEIYEENLKEQVHSEKDRLWKSMISWAAFHSNYPSDVFEDETQISAITMATNRSGTTSTVSMTSSTVSCLPASHREEVMSLLLRARSAYGRTALCLSGGAMMGLYHFGHVLGLIETGALPKIISGTSAGSVVGAILCTRTDDEIKEVWKPEVLVHKLTCFERPWMERIISLFKTGCMFDYGEWLDLIQWFTCGQTTFEEAYKKTGRTFCITVSATTKKAPPVLLSHATTPNVTIASAVVASAAVPGLIPPVRLQYKGADGVVRALGKNKDQTYFDGSIEFDIPTNGLAEMFNCQFFIACQCNPHVVPFFYNSKGGVGRPSRWSSGLQEDSWRGGFLLAALEMYLKNDMKAKFKFLNDLEAAVGFTSTLLTQDFVGSTTIVPQIRLDDYLMLFCDPSLPYLSRCFQAGRVAAYQHCAMINLHYSIAETLEKCIDTLEGQCSQSCSSRSSWGQSPESLHDSSMLATEE